MSRAVVLSIALALTVVSCGARSYGDSGDGGEVFPSGGEATVGAAGREAFGFPVPGLSDLEASRFEVGDDFFTQPWMAPGGSDERDGLGPTYLSTSCIGCHEADGKSDRPAPGASEGSIVVVDHAAYGVQLQERAIDGVPGEGSILIEVVPGDDGPSFPQVSIEDPEFGPVAAQSLIGAPHLVGLGLLEAVPDRVVLAGADPGDADGDGISGRANVVWSPVLGGVALGRFGWKASKATVADQVAFAFLHDMGITSPVFPAENCPAPQTACSAAPSGGSPEIGADRFDAVVLYAQTLAVPARRRVADPVVERGEALFAQLGCAACHTPALETGVHRVAALSGQTIYPYTDLLVHDMGAQLADRRIEGLATGSEWRTAPLWGIGLTHRVNPQAGFLHDGRAATLDEAIRWHGGEAGASRNAYVALNEEQRAAVIAFLESL